MRIVVAFENYSAIKMAIMIEVIVKRRVERGEFLQRLGTPKFSHCALQSTEWLVRVSRPIIEPAVRRLTAFITDFFHCCTI
jgi:hypothetical protein